MVIHALDTPHHLRGPSEELRRQTERVRQLALARSIGSVIDEMHRLKIRQEQERRMPTEEMLIASGELATRGEALVT